MTASARSEVPARPDTATALLVAAACAGLVHAAFSLYWALGGQWLLATVGRWAVDFSNERPLITFLTLGSVTAVKAVVALVPAAASRGIVRLPSRLWRGVAWLAAAVLTVYGGLNSVVAWLVLGGAITPAGGYDHDAMTGHGYLWDPLFLVWGLLLGAGLLAGRRVARSL